MKGIELVSGAGQTRQVGRRAYRQAHHGIPLGGPADGGSHALANRLVGNAADADALEITLLGPRLRITESCWFAIAGAPFEAHFDGEPVALGCAHRAEAGQTLAIRGTPRGARCYLAVGQGPPGAPVSLPAFNEPFVDLRITGGEVAGEYTVGQDSSRRGIRLTGPPLAGGEIITEGVSAGAIQVPPNGQPIILFVDQTTTGGYVKIAQVIRADLDRVGQLRPGNLVRFRNVTIEEAIALWRNRST